MKIYRFTSQFLGDMKDFGHLNYILDIVVTLHQKDLFLSQKKVCQRNPNTR